MPRNISLGIVAALTILAAAQAHVAKAENPGARELLQRELAARVPKPWQVHVTWRDSTLLAFVTPYPYQDAFDLWFRPEELHTKMLALCPAPGDQVWAQLSPEQNIGVEPTVGGKGGESLRFICPREGKQGN
jgi:hypothetical protein